MLKKLREVLKEIKDEKMIGDSDIDTEKLKVYKLYSKFQDMACELQKVPVLNLQEDERLCFWMNIYQVIIYL